jgi:thiamine pyridinylase
MVASGAAANAGALNIENAGAASIRCVMVAAHRRDVSAFDVAPNTTVSLNANGSEVDHVTCGAVRLATLGLSRTSGDRFVVLNGKQTRTLRVALFPYLPSYPSGDLSRLTTALEGWFQLSRPEVALQLVVSTDVDPYDYTALKSTFAQYDVVEVDTSILSALTNGRLIKAVPPAGDEPLDFAERAVAAPGGLQYGTPTWICRDFLFAYDATVRTVTSLPSLLSYWARLGTGTKIVGDFSGAFQRYSMYLNAYVARHGYGEKEIGAALQGPVDADAIGDLAHVVAGCVDAAQTNPCVDGRFNNPVPDGLVEPNFSSGFAAGYVGYPERSFFFELLRRQAPHVVAMPYGPKPLALFYVDALTYSALRCADRRCSSDARAFARFVTATKTRAFIAFSEDLPDRLNLPPRRLLSATKSFYALPRVLNDPVYAEIIPILQNAQPMPTTLTKEGLTAVASKVCGALKVTIPTYRC